MKYVHKIFGTLDTPPPLSAFSVLFVRKIGRFLDPPPNLGADVLNGWPLLPYASKERVISILLNEKPNFLETLFRPRRLPAAALDQGLLCTTSVTGTSNPFVIMY